MSEELGLSRLAVSLHGVRLLLESDSAEFVDYVASVMSPYVVSDSAPPAIRSRLLWVDSPPQDSLEETFSVSQWDRRPDRDLYIVGDNAAYWLRIDDFADLKLAVESRPGELGVTGHYHFQVGRNRRTEALQRLRYRNRMVELRARRFSTILYYMVYHPILWWLSRYQAWHVLHGGAVSDGRRTVLFTGMPGCGKSTLVVAMLSAEPWAMLSDNLVLHDGKRVRACPEVLLLDPRSLARVGPAAKRLMPTGESRVFGRDAYRPDRSLLEALEPTVIFNVGRAHKTELVALDDATAAARLIAGNTMAKEVRRVGIMGEVIDLVAATTAPDGLDAVRRLVASVPCYDLWVEEKGDAASVVNDSVMPAIASAVAATRPLA